MPNVEHVFLIEYVAGSTAPCFVWIFRDRYTGETRDLTGCSGIFRTRLEQSSPGEYVVDSGCDVYPVSGMVQYCWGLDDLAVVGHYLSEIELINCDGSSEFHQTPRIQVIPAI